MFPAYKVTPGLILPPGLHYSSRYLMFPAIEKTYDADGALLQPSYCLLAFFRHPSPDCDSWLLHFLLNACTEFGEFVMREMFPRTAITGHVEEVQVISTRTL